MRQFKHEFISGVAGALFILSLPFLLIMCSGCEFFRKMSKSETEVRGDSVNVKKATEVSSSVDTSKSKIASTKETVYYPQPIIVPGKDGETKIVFVPQTVKETGTEEKQNYNFENYRKDFLDSMRMAKLEAELNKKSETEGSILGIGLWIGIAIVGVVLIGLLIALVHFKNQIVNIKSLLPKN